MHKFILYSVKGGFYFNAEYRLLQSGRPVKPVMCQPCDCNKQHNSSNIRFVIEKGLFSAVSDD